MGLATLGFFHAITQRHRAEAALALADDNFRDARAAVEDLLQISDERLQDQPGLQPLRRELMKAAIDRYEPFLAKPIPDPTPRQELARLYARHGQLMLERTEVLDQSVMAEFERALIQERVRAGLRNAQAKGKKLGRPRLNVDERQLRAVAGQPVRIAAKALGISPSSYIRYVREHLGHSHAAEEAVHG